MIEIIPAIIPKNAEELGDRLAQVSGLVKKVQVDIVDGQFVPHVTWPFREGDWEEFNRMVKGELKFPNPDNIKLELDMMVVSPTQYIDEFAKLGFDTFIIHYGSTEGVEYTFDVAKSFLCGAALALRPSDDLGGVANLIELADYTQFMGSDDIGHSGGTLDDRIYDKIREFKKLYPSKRLQVDIGVNRKTAPLLREAGADALVSGSAVFCTPDIAGNIERLRV